MIKLTTNKRLYRSFTKQDTFSDRLIIFLLHFAFFLKVYKTEKNSVILQEIYDFYFKQLELSIREIISEIHFWDNCSKNEKKNKISLFIEDFDKNEYLIDYFDDFKEDLLRKNLNYFLKSVSNP